MPNQRGFWNWFLRGIPVLSINEPAGMGVADQRRAPRENRNDSGKIESYVPLKYAVEQFNLRAHEDRIGREQPPLTVDEVVTSIRTAGRHQLPLTENHRRRVHAIAETRRVPLDAQLKFTNTWVSLSGYRCEVWWIDLVMSIPLESVEPNLTSSSSLRIRDHRLRSWHDPSITIPHEIQRLQVDQRWFPANTSQFEEPAHP